MALLSGGRGIPRVLARHRTFGWACLETQAAASTGGAIVGEQHLADIGLIEPANPAKEFVH